MPVITRKFMLLKNYIRILRSLEEKIVSVDEFTEDFILRGAVERYLHLAVEVLIDIGFRICSLLELEKPDRYRDLARILKEAGFLSKKSADLLELWIGFRNIMVHAYARIKPSKVLEALKSIGDLERIASEIRRNVDEKKLDPSQIRDEAIMEVFRNFRVVFAYIFGSYATGRARNRSDVDIAVYVEEGGLSWKEHVSLMHSLEDVIGKRVDLVILNETPLLLAYEIVSKGRLIYSRDDELRAEFEAKVLHEYLDIKLKTGNI